MKESYSQAEIFSIIADIIVKVHKNTQSFVTHEEILHELLTHPHGNEIVRLASKKKNKPIEWMGGNMIAWFSQKITANKSIYSARFDRILIGNKWAYKPKA